MSRLQDKPPIKEHFDSFDLYKQQRTHAHQRSATVDEDEGVSMTSQQILLTFLNL
jgi:hypothetical protein